MPLLGAHMSIVGGMHQAVYAAAKLQMDTVQVFTSSPQLWAVRPLGDDDTRSSAETEVVMETWQAKSIHEAVGPFQQALVETGLRFPIAHHAYLINMAAPDDLVWQRSIAAMVLELRRAGQLGLTHVIAHPGAPKELGDVAGLKRIAAALEIILDQTRDLGTCIALETTAGQGSCLGWRFEHLRELLQGQSRLAVCLDTCHIFAGGYALYPRRRYMATMRDFDKKIGFEHLVALHLNDSKGALGSRLDRHQHIGKGHIGLEAFGFLLNDRRVRHLPCYLETPKGTDPETGQPWDAINLATLRALFTKP